VVQFLTGQLADEAATGVDGIRRAVVIGLPRDGLSHAHA
jgi:hypothetical protein